MKNSTPTWLFPTLFVIWIFFVLGTFFTVQKPFSGDDIAFVAGRLSGLTIFDWLLLLLLGPALWFLRRRFFPSMSAPILGILFLLGSVLIAYKPFSAANVLAMGNVALDLLATIWLALIALGLGRWVLHRLCAAEQPVEETLILGTGLGLGVLGLLSFGLGLLQLFQPVVVYSVTVVLSLIATPQLVGLMRQWRRRPLKPPGLPATIYLLFIVWLSLMTALTPPTDWDGLFYHLTGPKLYLQNGGVSGGVDIPHLSFPSLMEMLFAWAMLLRGDIAAKLLHTLFGFLLAGLVYLIAARFFSRKSAWPAVLIFASMPMIPTLAGWAYNDLALAFYQLAALYAIVVWLEDRRPRTEDRRPRTEDRGLGIGDRGPAYKGRFFETHFKTWILAKKIGDQATGVRSPQPSAGAYKGRFFESRFGMWILAKKIGSQATRVRPPQPPTGGSRGQSSDLTRPRASISADFSNGSQTLFGDPIARQTLFARHPETKFPEQGRSQTEFGNEGQPGRQKPTPIKGLGGPAAAKRPGRRPPTTDRRPTIPQSPNPPISQSPNRPTSQSPLPWLILSGVFAGLAMGLKYTSFVTPLVIGGLILWQGIREQMSRGAEAQGRNYVIRNTQYAILIFSLTASLTACPWYLKNWLFTGNPVYPFLYDFFGGLFWDEFRAGWYAAAGTGIAGRPVDFVNGMNDLAKTFLPGEPQLNLSLSGQYYFNFLTTLLTLPVLLTLGIQDVNYWDGRTGPLLLLFLPFILFYGLYRYGRVPDFRKSGQTRGDSGGYPRAPLCFPKFWDAPYRYRRSASERPAALNPLLIYALAHFVVWTLGIIWSRPLWQSRLLLSGLVALAPVAGWVWVESARFDLPSFSISRFVTIAVGLTLFLTVIDVGLLTLKIKPLPYLIGIETRADYLTRRLGAHYYAMQQINDALPPDSKIVFLWEPRSYYCRRDCQPDSILDTFPHLAHQYDTAEAVNRIWRAEGVTHLLVHRAGLDFVLNETPEVVDQDLLATLERRYWRKLFTVGEAYQVYKLEK